MKRLYSTSACTPCTVYCRYFQQKTPIKSNARIKVLGYDRCSYRNGTQCWKCSVLGCRCHCFHASFAFLPTFPPEISPLSLSQAIWGERGPLHDGESCIMKYKCHLDNMRAFPYLAGRITHPNIYRLPILSTSTVVEITDDM